MKIIAKPMVVSQSINEQTLQTTPFGKKVYAKVKECVDNKFLKSTSVAEYLRMYNKLIPMGTCSGETMSVVISKNVNHGKKDKDVVKLASSVDAHAGQILEYLRGDLWATLHGRSGEERREAMGSCLKKDKKLVKSMAHKAKKEYKHNKKMLKEVKHEKKIQLKHIKKLTTIAKDQSIFETNKIEGAKIINLKNQIKRIIEDNRKNCKDFAGLSLKETKSFVLSKTDEALSLIKKQSKDSKGKETVIYCCLQGNPIGHAILIFCNKKPQVYDAQKGLIQYKSVKDLTKDFKKSYFKSEENLTLGGTPKGISLSVYNR